MRALAASRDRHAYPARLLPLPPPPAQRPHEVDGVLTRDGVLNTDTALGLCGVYGIPAAEWAVVNSVEGALVVAGVLGYPLALKALSVEVSHKSDVGGVALGINDREMLRAEFAALLARVEKHVPDARVDGVLVQRMLSGGQEVILAIGPQPPHHCLPLRFHSPA